MPAGVSGLYLRDWSFATCCEEAVSEDIHAELDTGKGGSSSLVRVGTGMRGTGWLVCCVVSLATAGGACRDAQPPARAETSAAGQAETGLAQESYDAREALLEAIHKGWNELSRSTNDCYSVRQVRGLTDPGAGPAGSIARGAGKMRAPLVYLPVEVSEPDRVKWMAASCGVMVKALPRVIAKGGDGLAEEMAADGEAAGLLYLPNKYVTSNDTANVMYGWESYCVVLGLIADEREELARGMVDNLYFEVEHYGTVLRANRSVYAGRPQPPVLTSMMRAVYEAPASFRDAGTKRLWLEKGYALADREYGTWTSAEHRAGDTGLSRYFDREAGPAPEVEDSISAASQSAANQSAANQSAASKSAESPVCRRKLLR